MASPAFPKTVCGVVFQGAAQGVFGHGCQFSFACDGSMRHGLETQAWDRARRIAERTISGVVLADIGSATHFHTTGVQPAWGPQMLRVTQVGLHIFYRLNPHAPLTRPENRPVFVSLPLGPASNLGLAKAVVEKAAETTVSTAAKVSASLDAAKPTEALSPSRSAEATAS